VNLGRFEIVRELGRGSSATVYLARDRALELELALKVLHPAAGGVDRDRAFFHEARAVAGLRHPGVVAIYDVDEPARTLVMEYVPGGTVRDQLRARQGAEATPQGLDPAELMPLAGRLLATPGLRTRPRRGAWRSPRPATSCCARRANRCWSTLAIARTREGQGPVEEAAGTPLYLAPERMRGAPASERTDLFAAGALLWEAVGGPPHAFPRGSAGRHHRIPPIAPRIWSPRCPESCAPSPGLITALTSGAPERRPATAQEALALLGL
jgi:serine/threonine-protein kinase